MSRCYEGEERPAEILENVHNSTIWIDSLRVQTFDKAELRF
jgi:hypothetical protein